MSETAALWALAVSAFTSATILPGTSEVSLLAFVKAFPSATFFAWLIATIANTAGGMTSYALGRFIPASQVVSKIETKTRERLQRFGVFALLFSWVPIVGDALCVAAGALRLNVWGSLVALMIGKAVRYGVVLGVFNLAMR